MTIEFTSGGGASLRGDGIVGLETLVAVHDEDRARCLVEHVGRDASVQEPPDAAPAVSADHDQARAAC